MTFADGAKLDGKLWYSPAISQDASTIHVTPLAQGLQGMREYKIAFAAHSRAAAFVSPDQPMYNFESLATLPSDQIHIGSQVGRVYRLVLREDRRVYALLMVLLEFVTQPKKRSKQGSFESKEELAVRQSSPKSWTVAFIPTPETFAPLPAKSEVGVTVEIQWGLPPSLQQLDTRTVGSPFSVCLKSGLLSPLITCYKWPRCPSSINLRPWASPTRCRSPINLTELKNCCIVYMSCSDC